MERVEYPQEYFIKIEGEEFREGRLTLNHQSMSGRFNVEIDIVLKETRKIWRHVEILYNFDDSDDALEIGIQHLSNFLLKK